MKVGIIGAGLTGIVSAKYCLEQEYEITVFEQSGAFGGIWRYRDQVGQDEYGVPVNSPMYKNLRTNLPKEIMVLRGLEHENVTTSYVSQAFILKYLERYVDKFNILPHIKFRHQVMNARPLDAGKWEVTVKNVLRKTRDVYTFDALMVCNGHYSKIKMPTIPGMEVFGGVQLHSRDYRSPEFCANRTVVLVGAGPSGIDLAKHISKVAKTVFLSKNEKSKRVLPVAENIVVKPEITSISKSGCNFKDGSQENADVILYCTGYETEFPFLTEESGITVDDNRVEHLYRHLVNIEHPTMGLVGLLWGLSVFPVADLLARYFVACLSGQFQLPDKEEMLASEEREWQMRLAMGYPKRHAHMTPDHAEAITNQMADEAGFERIPEAVFRLHDFVAMNRSQDLCYELVGDESFRLIKCNDFEIS